MATALADTCSVCTEEFDSSHRQSLALPCGHHFCLSCLVRLRSRGKNKCPTCRRSWAMMALPIPPQLEALAAALESDQEEEEEEEAKKKGEDDRCKKHSMPYDFWVNAKKEFYCKKCAAEDKSHVILDIIEDAIPQIKAAFSAEAKKTKKLIEKDLKSLDEKHESLLSKRNTAIEFMKAVEALKVHFDEEIKEVAEQRAKVMDISVQTNKVEKKIAAIKSTADLGVVMECQNALKRVGAAPSVPAKALPQTLLCDIARSYVEEATTKSPPSRASFVNAMLKGSSVGPLTEAAWAGAPSSTASDDRSVKHVWQWEVSPGVWSTYGGPSTTPSDNIERHYSTGCVNMKTTLGIRTWILDFGKMILTQEHNNAQLRVRRVPKRAAGTNIS